MSLSKCGINEFSRIDDERGSLSFIESRAPIPFEIKRIYYLYDIKPDGTRGAHGHRKLEQFIIPIVGSFDVELDDGLSKRTFHLNKPNVGLYVCPMMWRDLSNFSANAICLVLASELYDEADYFREYDAFIAARRDMS